MDAEIRRLLDVAQTAVGNLWNEMRRQRRPQDELDMVKQADDNLADLDLWYTEEE